MEIDLTDSIRWKSIWPIRWISYQIRKTFLNQTPKVRVCRFVQKKNTETFKSKRKINTKKSTKKKKKFKNMDMLDVMLLIGTHDDMIKMLVQINYNEF